jgi:hypothetical protein
MGRALVLGLVVSWLATELRPFTWPALAVTLAAGLGAVAVGRRARVEPGRARTLPPGVGEAVSAVLLLALAAWELAAFLQHPRAEHPTLSSLADALLRYHPVRAAAFLAWLAAGVGLGRR